jgi:hypothetical protein
MKSKDQLLLEATYQEIANQTKDLYKQIKPLAEKILGDEKMVAWDLDEEDKQSKEFSHYTQFALKRITINAGSPKEYPSIQFGNLHGGQLWGDELSPHATTLKRYAAILKVLQKKTK